MTGHARPVECGRILHPRWCPEPAVEIEPEPEVAQVEEPAEPIADDGNDDGDTLEGFNS